ncbi:hypothetical protein PKB_3358 [Pseudomonas knackmussii B13]|uniref:Uncharacterized protein n=1 Tax=Pseudomonas knackmussii (strain DSM 6978 / CCUG 54928 / LMG 23759 / B13) TaxID=1301098 RepID=A0A024HJK0_PSEKB|nr:hypothetical protein [Pseudomonas knackmussii]CDF84702.1 hypothetical protein PKB_3358 [Pseudomonas knackmussii B13]
MSGYWFGLGVVVFIALFSLGLHQEGLAYQRRNKSSIDQAFREAMAQHGIASVETLQEHMNLGSRRMGGKRLFEVHRILHSAPDRWFVYMHVEYSDPVLVAISEQRAMTALNNKG